jgi:hypothetical protein
VKFHELTIGDPFMLEKESKMPLVFKKVSDKHYVTKRNNEWSVQRYPFQIESDVFPIGVINDKSS